MASSIKKNKEYTLNLVADANTLVNSFKKCKQNTSWKESVQKYEINLLSNTRRIKNKLLSETYTAMPFYEFYFYEKGAERWIRSMHISDRVVQRAICDEVLNPMLNKYLIYDNGASQKGKGFDFTLDRVEKHLHDFFVQNNFSNEGYAVKIDFTKYFDNLPHDVLYEDFTLEIEDEQLKQLIKYLISLFEIDLSILPKEMAERYENGIYNSIEYNRYLRDNHLKQSKDSNYKLKKSAGVGSQISQNGGIFYPYKIDNYFKIVKGIKQYDRYMDDALILTKTLEEAKEIVNDFFKLCSKYKININKKKTQIIKLSKGFTFLKVRHKLTKTGKVLRKSISKNIYRQKRKMRKLFKIIIEQHRPFKSMQDSYISARGRLAKYNPKQTIKDLDMIYIDYYLTYSCYHLID